MGGSDRTTITVSRKVKNRFLRFVGAPKKYDSADEALVALMDKWDGKGEVRSASEGRSDGVKSS